MLKRNITDSQLKLTCICETLQTANLFASGDNVAVIDGEPTPCSHMQNKPRVCFIGSPRLPFGFQQNL